MELEESTYLTSGPTTKPQLSRQYGTGTKVINADQPEIRKLLGDDYRWYYRIPVLKYYGHWEDFFFQHTQLKYDYRRVRYLDRGALLEFKRIPTREALLEQLRVHLQKPMLFV